MLIRLGGPTRARRKSGDGRPGRAGPRFAIGNMPLMIASCAALFGVGLAPAVAD
jgi:hypothetical protein